ncbi:MAG: hypothetical protein WBW81_16205 [Methylocella sp.]
MFVRRSFSLVSISAASIVFGLAPFGRTAAQDVRHVCSEKYRAAKAAGTLNGETWQQFYSKCTAESKANPPASAAAPPPPSAPSEPVVAAPAPVNPLKKAATKPALPAAAATAPSTAVFPTAIAPAYANEKPGKARMKTCDDQYKANKATNANGGLKWIQKGDGYWSECNKRLKGGA